MNKYILLFSVFIFMSSSCPRRAPGPKVKVYVSKPEMGGLYRSQDGELIDYVETENYRCLSKTDTDALLNWCLNPSVTIKSKKGREKAIHNINLAF